MIKKAICIKKCVIKFCRHKQKHDCFGDVYGGCPHAKNRIPPCRPLNDVLAGKTGARYQGASRSRCLQQHSHQSGLEAGVCDDLFRLQRMGAIKSIETQYKMEFTVNHVHICNHFVDFFVVWKKNPARYLMVPEVACFKDPGHVGNVYPGPWKTVIEVKGAETELWVIKHRLAVALYCSTEPQEKAMPYIVLKRRIFKI